MEPYWLLPGMKRIRRFNPEGLHGILFQAPAPSCPTTFHKGLILYKQCRKYFFIHSIYKYYTFVRYIFSDHNRRDQFLSNQDDRKSCHFNVWISSNKCGKKKKAITHSTGVYDQGKDKIRGIKWRYFSWREQVEKHWIQCKISKIYYRLYRHNIIFWTGSSFQSYGIHQLSCSLVLVPKNSTCIKPTVNLVQHSISNSSKAEHGNEGCPLVIIPSICYLETHHSWTWRLNFAVHLPLKCISSKGAPPGFFLSWKDPQIR